MQSKLVEQGYEVGQKGVYDLKTEAAVRQFQEQKGLLIDGKVGSLTWSALLYVSLSLEVPRTPKVVEDIKFLQSILHREGFLKEVNGHFDPTTQWAVQRFQQSQGLVADGQCGPRTWSVLLGQRTSPASRSEIRMQVLEHLDGFFWEQMLIIIFIAAGMHVNPLNQAEDISLLKSLIVSYALTWIGPLALDQIFERFPIAKRFPLFRFAPYVAIGLIWRELIGHILKFSS
ncbi:peptidoglycan-binding domain-containing protein [Nodosilinea sp. PGN35]|uniref:peptidoglycan-binding domain-containing protein n=1 Tax=Nodosilinea sp. PGN35 TaxID=3020489 RepID=UPI0023B25D8A|nr:peptidoglycan-binding protein [Nodosilinea sp. TSF1-S3]MDF0367962.1 peptidoglycan-binding protein [Nodosilinea sp. TSF1-S3]